MHLDTDTFGQQDKQGGQGGKNYEVIFSEQRRPLVPFAVLRVKKGGQRTNQNQSDFVQVGLWEEGGEEEWKVRVGDRLKEKLERAREGEMHHVLDHEEEHWMQMSGIQIHHVSLREGC